MERRSGLRILIVISVRNLEIMKQKTQRKIVLVFIFCLLYSFPTFAQMNGIVDAWVRSNQIYQVDVSGNGKKSFLVLTLDQKNEYGKVRIKRIIITCKKAKAVIFPYKYFSSTDVKFHQLDLKTFQVSVGRKEDKIPAETYIYQYKKGTFVLLHKNIIGKSIFLEDKASIKNNTLTMEAVKSIHNINNKKQYEYYRWKNVYVDGKSKTNLYKGVAVTRDHGNKEIARKNLTVVNGKKKAVIKKGSTFVIKKIKLQKTTNGEKTWMLYLSHTNASGWYDCGWS